MRLDGEIHEGHHDMTIAIQKQPSKSHTCKLAAGRVAKHQSSQNPTCKLAASRVAKQQSSQNPDNHQGFDSASGGLIEGAPLGAGVATETSMDKRSVSTRFGTSPCNLLRRRNHNAQSPLANLLSDTRVSVLCVVAPHEHVFSPYLIACLFRSSLSLRKFRSRRANT